MSIVALKRNSRRFKARISGQGSKGFSLSGGHRNQGWVGQGVRGRSLTGTPFRGAVAMGNGGCCGTYVKKINNRSSNCCTNDPTIVKRSTMNTLGHIDSTVIYPTAVFSDSCRDGNCPKIQNWVKDFSPHNHSEGQRIFKKARKSAKCVNLKDDAGLDTCHKGCKSASYHIGGKKKVREMYAKNLNMLAVGSEEYQRTSLMSTVNLPTPDCKKPYPMELNHTGNCQKNFMTSDDAIIGGMLPKDWMNCNKCLNPGMSYITHLDSQDIPIHTSQQEYTNEQLNKLDGQFIKNANQSSITCSPPPLKYGQSVLYITKDNHHILNEGLPNTYFIITTYVEPTQPVVIQKTSTLYITTGGKLSLKNIESNNTMNIIGEMYNCGEFICSELQGRVIVINRGTFTNSGLITIGGVSEAIRVNEGGIFINLANVNVNRSPQYKLALTGCIDINPGGTCINSGDIIVDTVGYCSWVFGNGRGIFTNTGNIIFNDTFTNGWYGTGFLMDEGHIFTNTGNIIFRKEINTGKGVILGGGPVNATNTGLICGVSLKNLCDGIDNCTVCK